MAEMRIESAERMRGLTEGIFKGLGMPADDAAFMGRCLVDADVRGVLTHGCRFIPIYYKWAKDGTLNLTPQPKVLNEAASMIAYDADDSLGHLISARAMQNCIDKAKQTGAAVATVRNSRHCGAMAFYSQMAADAGCIGQAVSNGGVMMAPFGGIDRLVGLNPVSWAAPTNKPWSFNLDMATSVVAGSKIMLAMEKGEQIPLGWAIDSEGKPTSDPKAATKGALLPLGGAKGFGLALMLDIVCGVLSGGRFGANQGLEPFDKKENQFSQYFLAVDIKHFMPLSEFKERMGQLIDKVKSGRTVEGGQGVMVAGEIEYNNRQRLSQEGIPYPAGVMAEIERIAAEVGAA